MASSTLAPDDSGYFPDVSLSHLCLSSSNETYSLQHQPDGWALWDEGLTDLTEQVNGVSSGIRGVIFSGLSSWQEIPETQKSISPLSSIASIAQEEDPTMPDAHSASSLPSTRKRKRQNEPQKPTGKKLRQRAREPPIVDNASLPATRLQIAKQDLESEREKVRVLEKEIMVLKEVNTLLLARLEAREETIEGRNRNAGQEDVEILQSRVERYKLTITVIDNVITLSKLTS